jgi:hypothetical protein
MGRIWVLDTDTKGTGAEMVPLDTIVKKPEAERDRPLAQVKRKPQAPKPPEPRKPRAFKVVDVMSREVLAEDVDARGALAALAGVRSLVDVWVYVWAPKADRWRLLTLAEQRALWERRPESSCLHNQSL